MCSFWCGSIKNSLKRKVIKTADGSSTLQIEGWNEQYHSLHGAIQEAYHVFIESGLRLFSNQKISILEMGFGTGLNALITLIEAPSQKLKIDYTGVEAHPVLAHELAQLNYVKELKAEDYQKVFETMHAVDWGKSIDLNDYFSIIKQQIDFFSVDDEAIHDLIYFDAFGARVQPELWTTKIFSSMFRALKKNGILVTYAAKGSVRRAMIEVGFNVERLPGPPGKREMLRARKV